MGLFGDSSRSDLRRCARLVEDVIAELGLSPLQNRLPQSSDSLAWALVKGSAEVYIFLNASSAGNYIQVVSPIVRLPDFGLLPLYRRLLELNADELLGASFGIKGDSIVLTTDRAIRDIDRSEVREMILRIGNYADHFDDELASQFGGRRHTDDVNE
jgi:hypothetical protein